MLAVRGEIDAGAAARGALGPTRAGTCNADRAWRAGVTAGAAVGGVARGVDADPAAPVLPRRTPRRLEPPFARGAPGGGVVRIGTEEPTAPGTKRGGEEDRTEAASHGG